MIEAALIALASTAASTIASAIATDAWTEVKDKFAHFLGRGDSKEILRFEAYLERSSSKVLAAQNDGAEELLRNEQAAWIARLEDFLDRHPESATQLQELLAVLPSNSANLNVRQTVVGQDNSQQAIQGHGVQNVNFGKQ